MYSYVGCTLCMHVGYRSGHTLKVTYRLWNAKSIKHGQTIMC